MGSTGFLYIDGEPVYGWIVVLSDAVRLRVSSGEWRTLELEAGAGVTVQVPGQARRMLIGSVVEMPDTGLTWIEFLPSIFVDRGRLNLEGNRRKSFKTIGEIRVAWTSTAE